MSGSALRIVPARQDRRLRTATVARLLGAGPDGLPAAVIARGREGTHLRLLRSADGNTTPLRRDKAQRLRRKPDLVRCNSGELFCLAPGVSLMRLAWRNGTVQCEGIPIDGEIPDRLFAAGDGLFGVHGLGSDRPTVAALKLTDAGAIVAAEPLPLPPIDAAATISAVALDPAGKLVLTADHPTSGFRLWRQSLAASWTLEIADGAARFGINAVLHDLTVWGDLVILAVGGDRSALGRHAGLRFPGEILVLRPDGSHAILCGETRISRSGLMTPLAGQASAAALEGGDFTRLASDGETLFAVAQRPASARIFRIGPGFEIMVEGEIEGTAADLAIDRGPGAPVNVLTLQEGRNPTSASMP